MTDPVDLQNLHDLTDGDREFEQELFDEFLSSSHQMVQTLKHHIVDQGDNEEWRSSAHALKGISYNLGAEKLGDLCKQAQESCDAEAKSKIELLDQIKSEYDRVVDFLNQQ